MTQELAKKYSVGEVSRLDRENRELVSVYSASRIKIGLELAKRLKEFEDNKLYLKLDNESYPSFGAYLKSLDINYKTAREAIGLYETFVLTAGYTINELAEVNYYKLTRIKPLLFEYQAKEGSYKQLKPKTEIKQWISDAKSEMTAEDLMQKRREEEAGDHSHAPDSGNWSYVTYRVCNCCGLRERVYEKKKEIEEKKAEL